MVKGAVDGDKEGLALSENGDAVAQRRGASLFGVSVEYGLHTLLWLVAKHPKRASSRDLAEIQGLPAAMLAKIMPKLEKAGIVTSSDGISGGYELAQPPETISVLAVVDAIEAGRTLFDCKEVRRGCVLFGGTPPPWSIDGVCRIHAVMLRAEKRMRSELKKTSLADLAQGGRPKEFESLVGEWFRDRSTAREAARVSALKVARSSPA